MSITATSTPTTRASTRTDAGVAAEKAHQWARALRLYQESQASLNRALQLRPGDADTLDFLRRNQARIQGVQGYLAAEAGNYEQAIRFLQEAARIYPADRGYYEGNIPWVRSLEASAREKARIESIRARADAAHDQKDWKTAEALWRELAAATPGDWSVHYNLGIALKLQGRFEEALAAYREAHRLNPKDPKATEQLEFVEAYVKTLRQEQALQRQDSQAAAGVAESVGTLIQHLQDTNASGPTRSEWRWVNGKLVEFTTLEHPRSGPSTAGDQGVSAKVEGQAAHASSLEDAKDRSGLVFDTPGGSYGGLPTLSLPPERRPSDEIIAPYKDNKVIQQLLQERAKARQEYRELGDKLKAVNAKLANSPAAEKGALQVEASELLNQMAGANNRAYTADLKAQEEAQKLKAKQDFGVDMTETNTPGATPVPSPAPAGNSPQGGESGTAP